MQDIRSIFCLASRVVLVLQIYEEIVLLMIKA